MEELEALAKTEGIKSTKVVNHYLDFKVNYDTRESYELTKEWAEHYSSVRKRNYLAGAILVGALIAGVALYHNKEKIHENWNIYKVERQIEKVQR